MICSFEYDVFLCRPKKIGTLITADGSDDELILPEGLSNEKVLLPCMLDSVPTLPIS